MFAGLLASTLLALSLPLTLAGSHDMHRRHHAEVARRQEGNVSLYGRAAFQGTRATFYNVETGQEVACGGTYHNGDSVVAMSLSTFDKGRDCGRQITISFAGKTVPATIVDGCEACPPNCLDLTQGLFASIADLGLGVIAVDWADAGGAPAAPAPAPVPTPDTPVPVPTPAAPETPAAPAAIPDPTPTPAVIPTPDATPSASPSPSVDPSPSVASSSVSPAASSAFPTGPAKCQNKRSLRRRRQVTA